ncbi:hypothetical protein JD844_022900 [Phrynosoma platyrhinos]|uniref:Uncharacterized protein n=1 Tax=Phrynosoma platyrhinos TaxID=52577 RepID=A0ABQ7SVQ8_PHRPL|nr:hypothetical protein JD844_022900 [Phrynosoma platyrhinos]
MASTKFENISFPNDTQTVHKGPVTSQFSPPPPFPRPLPKPSLKRRLPGRSSQAREEPKESKLPEIGLPEMNGWDVFTQEAKK